MNKPLAFWSLSTTEMLQQLQTAKEGLTAGEARERLARYGSNLPKAAKRPEAVTLLFAQFKSPLILILFFATGLSFFLHEPNPCPGMHWPKSTRKLTTNVISSAIKISVLQRTIPYIASTCRGR